MVAEQLAPKTINNYLTLLGMILNAAVDSDYLPRSPLKRKSGAGRVATVKNETPPRREVWLTCSQLDQLAEVDALKAHRELVGEDASGLVFTTEGGSRGPGGMVPYNNFRRIWQRAIKNAGLADAWPEDKGLHFHDLRHTHGTWLLAQRVPMIAVANRLGHANGMVTMTVYAHVSQLVERSLQLPRS